LKERFVLLDSGQMRVRLAALKADPHLVEQFHPKLLRSAGVELTRQGLVKMIKLVIAEYTDGMMETMRQTVLTEIKDFGHVDALTDDPEAREILKAAIDELY